MLYGYGLDTFGAPATTTPFGAAPTTNAFGQPQQNTSNLFGGSAQSQSNPSSGFGGFGSMCA